MKILQVTNSLATGGAEKLIVDYTPRIAKKDIAVDVLVLNGQRHPFMENLAKTHCCEIHSLTKGSVYNPLLVFKIIPYLRNYDLLHVHLFPALYWVAIAKMISFSRARIIYTEHSTHNRRRNSKLFRLLDRIIYRCYKKIVVISEEVQRSLSNHIPLKLKVFEK